VPEYYLDIETNARGEKPDINDEILTIQFQRLGTKTGEEEGDLTILKSWESSEKEILKEFYFIFSPDNPFKFVPIGENLSFDFFALHHRWQSIGINVPLKTLIYDHPCIDIKSILVIFNEGSFKGASLKAIFGKTGGVKVPEWYANGNYNAIEDYIRREAEDFIQFYQKLKKELPLCQIKLVK